MQGYEGGGGEEFGECSQKARHPPGVVGDHVPPPAHAHPRDSTPPGSQDANQKTFLQPPPSNLRWRNSALIASKKEKRKKKSWQWKKCKIKFGLLRTAFGLTSRATYRSCLERVLGHEAVVYLPLSLCGDTLSWAAESDSGFCVCSSSWWRRNCKAQRDGKGSFRDGDPSLIPGVETLEHLRFFRCFLQCLRHQPTSRLSGLK